MKGRRTWGILLATALVVFFWRQVSGPKPVGFIGAPPPVKFHPVSDFEHPAIDARVPGIGRVRLPNRRMRRSLPSFGRVLAGYFEWQGDVTKLEPRFEVDGAIVNASVLGAGLLKQYEYTDEIMLFEVPFATSEASREVTLVNGDGRWKLRLPVNTALGPTHRKAIQVKAGRYTVTIRPEPWHLTTAPLVLAVSSDAPKSVRLLIHLEWLDTSGAPGSTSQAKGWLIEGDRVTYVPIAQSVTADKAQGMIYELEAVPQAVRKGQPSRPNRLPWTTGIGLPPGNGFIAYEHDGQWHSDISPVLAPETRLPPPSMTLSRGESLGTAYKFIGQWPYQFTLDLQPARTDKEWLDPNLANKGIHGYSKSNAGQIHLK